jgi:two-component system, cell cycle response regulator
VSRSDVQSAVRIILVGRTGLDAALRLDESFELARAKSLHDALGELAHPLDDLSPSDTVVIISPDAVTDTDANGSAAPQRQRLVEFIRGLRLINPGVRVLGVAGSADADLRDLFDGLVRTSSAGDDIRSALSAHPRPITTPRAEPVKAPAAHVAPAAVVDYSRDPIDALQPSAPESADTDQGLGDQTLVEIAVRGQDLTPMALRVLRNRVCDAGLEFVPPPAGKSGGAPQGVPVVWSDAVLGYLVPSRAGGPDLTPHARWLAGWMRLRDQQDQLRHAAFTDPLTSAWNRRYLDRFLAGAITAAREQRWSVTVLMFDIDDFKKYNDQYGHDAGDEILTEVVRLLRSVTRPTDKVCRIGGDEFAVVFHEPEGPRSPDSKHPTTVSAITQRFQQQIIGHKFPKLSGCAPGTLTISGGLATFPWDGQTPAELMVRADERTMESKRHGKNAITIGPGAILKVL